MLGRTLGGGLTAAAAYEMVEGVVCQGSFDMPFEVLPALLSCLPPQAAAMATNALQAPATNIWLGGIIEMIWTVQLGEEDVGLYKHDPLIPLIVRVISGVARAEPLGPPPDDLPASILNLQAMLNFL
jgi:hypothetical protein